MRPVLLYSGGCRVCRFIARVLMRLDFRRELLFIPFRDPDAVPLLRDVPEGERTKTWWIFKDCKLTPGSHGGLIVLLKTLTFTRPVGKLLDVCRCSSLLDCLDCWIKGHRPQIAPWVPDGPAPRRFPEPEEVREDNARAA